MIKKFFSNCYVVETEKDTITLIKQVCERYNAQFTIIPSECVNIHFLNSSGNETILVFHLPTEYPEMVYASEWLDERSIMLGEMQRPRFKVVGMPIHLKNYVFTHVSSKETFTLDPNTSHEDLVRDLNALLEVRRNIDGLPPFTTNLLVCPSSHIPKSSMALFRTVKDLDPKGVFISLEQDAIKSPQ